ncbi:hypothetical protein VV089_09865 [Candidatus Merdisoma sp. JLR.KK011]|uniref:hypothetical protein n=1 Tax=Candidatus Merdisoma sp. JLR.KK011 TaxID=3114299 RepID=UPI002FEF2728
MKIKRVIDLTGENFDRINFEEAEILKFDFRNKDINNEIDIYPPFEMGAEAKP